MARLSFDSVVGYYGEYEFGLLLILDYEDVNEGLKPRNRRSGVPGEAEPILPLPGGLTS
jgi:hypothetical protein